MFMVLRKKQMVLTALVLMLGIAGYLNYRYDKDGVSHTAALSSEDVSEPDIGETVMVSSPADKQSQKKTNDPFVSEKLRRDAAREKTIDELTSLMNAEGTSQELKEENRRKLSEIAQWQEKEVTAENLLGAKGFKNTMVYITGESVTVTVEHDGISKSDTAKIVDVIFELTQNNNIKIVEVE